MDRLKSTDRSETSGATCRPPLCHPTPGGRGWPCFILCAAAGCCAKQHGQIFLLNSLVSLMNLRDQETGEKQKGCWKKSTAANEER